MNITLNEFLEAMTLELWIMLAAALLGFILFFIWVGYRLGRRDSVTELRYVSDQGWLDGRRSEREEEAGYPPIYERLPDGSERRIDP